MFRNKPLAQPHRVRRILGLVVIASSLTGCKAFNGGSGDRPAADKRGDPILGMRLPPQDVPVGGGKADLAGTKRDPLYTSPADRGRDKSSGQASKSGGGELSSLPPRQGASIDTRMPYRPGVEASPAALASGAKADDTLTMNRKATPASIVTPSDAKVEETYTKATRLLRDYNATWDTPEKTDGGDYSVTVKRSQSARNDGPFRKYVGVGATPAAALQSAADQLRRDLR